MKHTQSFISHKEASLLSNGWESSLMTHDQQEQSALTYRIDILGIFQDIQSFYFSVKERIREQSIPSEQMCKSF